MVEGWVLAWPWGALAVVAVVAMTILTDYLCPPFWFAERGELIVSQAGAGLFLALTILILGWVWSRHHGRGSAWLGRLEASGGLICAQAAGLSAGVALIAVVASLAIYSVKSNMMSLPVASLLSVVSGLSGLATLAPGLARLRLGKPILMLIVAVLVAGELGFLGTAFPLRASTLAGRPDVDSRVLPLPFTPDLIAALAGLFVSLGLGWTVRRGA